MKNLPWGGIVLGAALFYIWYKRNSIGAAINPASDKNLVYQGVNRAVGLDTSKASIGTKIYDLIPWHSDDPAGVRKQ